VDTRFVSPYGCWTPERGNSYLFKKPPGGGPDFDADQSFDSPLRGSLRTGLSTRRP
jgi:hypothetical protein